MTTSLLPSQRGTEPAPARPTRPARLTAAERSWAEATERFQQTHDRLVRTEYGCRLVDRIDALTRGRKP